MGSRPALGESLCGDAHLVSFEGTHSLLGLVDGLGHGPEAEAAASRAVTEILDAKGPIGDRIRACHQGLQRLRGVALTVAHISAQPLRLRYAGVGNVEGAVLGVPGHAGWMRLFIQSGLVGHRLPSIRDSEVPLNAGSLLILATDGIDPSFLEAVRLHDALEELVKSALYHFGRQDDDATILAARVLGESG